MNKDYRYQLESKKLTGHQPRKLICPNCGKKNWQGSPAVTQLVVPINSCSYVNNKHSYCNSKHSYCNSKHSYCTSKHSDVIQRCTTQEGASIDTPSFCRDYWTIKMMIKGNQRWFKLHTLYWFSTTYANTSATLITLKNVKFPLSRENYGKIICIPVALFLPL